MSKQAYAFKVYDGELTLKVKGLWYAGKAIVTRHYQWKIEKG